MEMTAEEIRRKAHEAIAEIKAEFTPEQAALFNELMERIRELVAAGVTVEEAAKITFNATKERVMNDGVECFTTIGLLIETAARAGELAEQLKNN